MPLIVVLLFTLGFVPPFVLGDNAEPEYKYSVSLEGALPGTWESGTAGMTGVATFGGVGVAGVTSLSLGPLGAFYFQGEATDYRR